ncbi:hypothetical protein [Chitinophaga sp. CF418]|uniref:hypothetical protein n=1 Tax=Chitinophaga sp. CF418 TaxID=1855287 RepID=UPI00091D39C2|nr:hypothetical protein [Chitinophaga sp. CF418]SHN24903.1 hypothetical protein SAMN05216311_107290 [Chitinophaga sp. CF418]
MKAKHGKLLVDVLLLMITYTGSYALSKPDPNTDQLHKQLYHIAFSEMSQMLSGGKPVNFKKAVFLMENAYLNGAWSYEQFNTKVSGIAFKLRQMIGKRHLERFHTAGNWAAFTYMTDSIQENNFIPFTYDFDHFLSDKDPTVGFVTKLLQTNKGNCNSLPFLYKILVEEIGASGFLALAPIHCYIKHKDEQGKWVNLEMTSGSFARDEWIMQETGVTVEQIKSGIYMNALTQKESIALVMKELAANYQFQFGIEDFDLTVCDTALHYFPSSVNLLMVKYEHYRSLLLQAKKQGQRDQEAQAYQMLKTIDKKLIELAYRSSPKDEYKNWVKQNKMSKK